MASGYPNLMFGDIKLRTRLRDGVREVWCASRSCYLQLTPEEWVRRHVVAFLERYYGLQPQQIVEEYPVSLNGTDQRADAVVVGCDQQPRLLVECKAAEVPIVQTTLAQAVRYNSVVGARYLILTNGLTLYCFDTKEGNCIQMSALPESL